MAKIVFNVYDHSDFRLSDCRSIILSRRKARIRSDGFNEGRSVLQSLST